jgi:hypothetical protein
MKSVNVFISDYGVIDLPESCSHIISDANTYRDGRTKKAKAAAKRLNDFHSAMNGISTLVHSLGGSVDDISSMMMRLPKGGL